MSNHGNILNVYSFNLTILTIIPKILLTVKLYSMKNYMASFFLIPLIILICLCISVCLRQNVLSMIHLIFLICFPLFQTSKSQNLNYKLQSKRLKQFIKLMVTITLLILILKVIYIVIVNVTHQNQNIYHSCDNIGQLLKALGLVNEIPDVTLDAILLLIFAIIVYFFPKSDSINTSTNEVLISEPVYKKIFYFIFVSKYSCLAVMCLNGIMVPSFACFVYYLLFTVITTLIVLYKLSNQIIACLFRIICFYTCIHIIVLFTYQIEWIQNIKININLKEFGLIVFYNSKCYASQILPEITVNNYFLPILLVIQHFMLWTYSDMISKNSSIIHSTTSNISMANEFKLKYIILVGIKTIGYKIVILVWCICYPGWLTLAMLLWTTVFWKYLNSRRNLIIILLLAISILLCEYICIVISDDLLKQLFCPHLKEWIFDKQLTLEILMKTLFTVTFWIALDQVDKNQLNEVSLKLLSTKSKYYISYIWIASLIFIMITYGFFGYYKINFIQIGYITLALLFLIIFQVSFQVWCKTMYIYWTVVVLYCILVVTVTYVLQFYGFAETLITHLHISNDLQSDIGLDKADSIRTIVPALIATAILVQFKYFHKHFISSLNAEIPINVSKTTDDSHKLNTLILIFHLHLNKLLIMLVMIMIMNKPCLLNIILLISMLLWILLDYNIVITNVLFLHIAFYIIVILGYQFPYFNHDKWTYQFQLPIDEHLTKHIKVQEKISTHQLNIAELFGLKKIDSNELLIHFLIYELFILLLLVLQKIILVYLEFTYYPKKPPLLIFPNIAYTDMNKGIPEIIMYLANYGFSLFGLEITFSAIAVVIYLSLDMYALICALWLLRFIDKNRQNVSIYWPYFVTFVYLVIIFKYVLYIGTTFNLDSEIPWKTIKIINYPTIIIYDVSYSAWIRPLMSFDFILLVLISHQLTVFKKERLQITQGNNFQENNNKTYEHFTDNLSETKSYLDVLKKIVFNNSMWIILFLIFWTGTKHVNIFSLGYLCAGTLFFWKGTYYFLMPLDMILKLWNGLLEYTITVMFIKVLFHLLGCSILDYLEWHSCIFMRVFSIFCLAQTSEKQTCDTSKDGIGLFLDVFIFMLVLFQRRFFESGHFLKLIDDTKAVAVLASKMCRLVNEWGRSKKVENRKTDLDSLEKIKVKLNNIRESKKRISKIQSKHQKACLDGEFMFEKIYDDVYLVVKYDASVFSNFENSVHGSWLCKQFVSFVIFITKKMNSYSEEHRQIMKTLSKEKKLLMKDSELFKLGQHEGSTMLWTPMNNIINLTDHSIRYYEDIDKHNHWLIQFILAIWGVVQSSTHLLCYFCIFYNALKNLFDVISMIPVIIIMFWGQLSVPRPTKTFWIVLITYMQITGLVKYICSFKEIPWIQEEVSLQNAGVEEFYSYPTICIGIGDYPNRIQTDLIILLLLFLHRRTLIQLGLWTYNNPHKEWGTKKIKLQYKNAKISLLRSMTFNIKTHLRPINEFYQDLRQYHTEGSMNVYPTMLLLMCIMVLVDLFTISVITETFTLNRVSHNFIVSFIYYLINIIIDRWLYAKRYILGKLFFHIVFISLFIIDSISYGGGNKSVLTCVKYLYILVSAYQIRNGYLYRHASSFIWSRYTIFNLIAHKIYFYCPFLHEIRTVLDWIWTDSSLTITEWFKMDDIFTHVCCVKCICNFREWADCKRGKPVSKRFKLLIGGGIIIAILSIIIFPVVWFSMFKSKPDTPLSLELTLKFGEDSIIFSTKSDDIHRLDFTDFELMKDIYLKSLKKNEKIIIAFLQQYEFDEISSINVIAQSINTWPIDTYEFNKFKKIILTSSSIKISVEWALTHNNGVKVSRGKNTVIMHDSTHSILTECLNMLSNKTNEISGACKQVVIPNLMPKFLEFHLKSSETTVQSELMIHNPSKPYMDVGLTFHYDETSEFTYSWNMVEKCPSDENASYLRKMPYSSCAVNDINVVTNNNTQMNIMYNIYVFSDRYSRTMQFLDDKGLFGLYTIIIVYFGYKLAFDIFRSFKFKMGYTETPYPDRILQLCYEIYTVRLFEEYEMEEDLYAMLIYLFRSPETLIRYTRRPADS